MKSNPWKAQTLEQAAQLALELGDDPPEAARAALFCAFLDRRTPLPLLHDLRFHLQLYRAARETGWIHAPVIGPGLLRGRGLATCGLDEPLACHVGQETLSEFVIEQTSLWHSEELRRAGTLRTVRQRAGARWEPGWPGEIEGRRRLALVRSASAQLGFDFG